MKKATNEDKRLWERMGRELAALDYLLRELHSDPDYSRVMDTKTWDRLGKMNYHLNIVRGMAENRMSRFVPDWSTRTFYPVEDGDIRAVVEKFRETVQKGEDADGKREPEKGPGR